MINYQDFAKTEDVAFNIQNALLYCKQHNEHGISFSKGEYRVFRERASEAVFCMSNHNNHGFKRALFLLEDFSDFTIDGNGSTFIFEDIFTPFIFSNCKNITLKNCTIIQNKSLSAQFTVVKSEGTSADLKVDFGTPFAHAGDLYEGTPKIEFEKLHFINQFDENCTMDDGVADHYMAGSEEERVCFSALENGLFHAENLPWSIPVGHKIVIPSRSRCMATVFVNRSTNTTVENVTVHSGIGMGFIAQNSDTITLNRFDLRQLPGRCYTTNADATHFVHCKGKIAVTNCFFEGQMDDALNVHSIYLKIVDKYDNKILVRYVHPEARGIDIIEPGSIVETADPLNLIPKQTYRVKSVRRINMEISEVELEDGFDSVVVGDVMNEISYVADVLFQNCTVRNNRARGMLLAAAGKIEILDNLFQTPGPAIKFEADGQYWYESGGTSDVIIKGNTFERCVRCGWGDAVVVVKPRERVLQDQYYHGKIAVTQNTFKNCYGHLANMNNMQEFCFADNTVENCEYPDLIIDHCKTIQSDI